MLRADMPEYQCHSQWMGKDQTMVSDELGKQLHDRATRGEALSPEEQAQLKDWYATQDRAEADQLGFTATAETVDLLQAQIDSAVAQLATITRRIQEIATENKALRREIAALGRQLAQQDSPQPV
jgi:septal ring factor EnvC (AmiA/AmiB activator)